MAAFDHYVVHDAPHGECRTAIRSGTTTRTKFEKFAFNHFTNRSNTRGSNTCRIGPRWITITRAALAGTSTTIRRVGGKPLSLKLGRERMEVRRG